MLRTPARINPGLLLLAAAAGGAMAAAQERVPGAEPEVRVTALSRYQGEGYSILVVRIERPADMAELSVEQPWWALQQVRWPRIAELAAKPADALTCYLEFTWLDHDPRPPTLDSLRFVALSRHALPAACDVALCYPRKDGTWGEAPLRLDLASATPLSTESKQSPVQRWATAQAHYFELLSTCTRDMGGFFTFAAQQTVRKYQLTDYKPRQPIREREGRSDDELYDITTGALAIQESLQLDRMTNADRDRGERVRPISDILAVGVASHPFDKMRGDRQPVAEGIAKYCPLEFYYARFHSPAKLLELLDFVELWGGSLLRLAEPVGRDVGVRQRTLRQLCLTDAMAAGLGPALINETAVCGSDPYLELGADVSVLFDVKSKDAFTAVVEPIFAAARREHADARHKEAGYGGTTIESLVDPQRRISCHRAWLGGVCIYSNSPAAIRRIIDTAKDLPLSVAGEPGFQYMRAAVFPLDEAAEDGFVYLSDPFIRRLVGPELRIKQKRRLEALTSLKLLTNAAMFHGYEGDRAKPTFEQLVAQRSLNADDLFDPEGGTLTWDAPAATARSSTWGDLGFLCPLIEVSADKATEKEAKAYDLFRERYQRYWRQYFDPVGVRIRMGDTIRLETHILPLIDSSTYDQFEDLAGGEPVASAPRDFSEQTLLRFVMKLRDGVAKGQYVGFLNMFTHTNATSDWLGDWLTFWVEDTGAFTTLLRRSYEAQDRPDVRRDFDREFLDVFNASFVFGAHAKNKVSLAAFLIGARTAIQSVAPDTVVFNTLQPYHGVTIVQIAPDPASPFAAELRTASEADAPGGDAATQPATSSAPSERGPALYYATIEDGFYIATQASALRNLIDRLSANARSGPPADTVRSNLLLYAAPGAAKLLRPAANYLMEQMAHDVSLANVGQVWMLGRCGLLDGAELDDAATRYLGYRLRCPDGGTYRYDARSGQASCSIHGTHAHAPRLDAPPPASPLGGLLDSITTVTAQLRFTEDGLATQIDIARR